MAEKLDGIGAEAPLTPSAPTTVGAPRANDALMRIFKNATAVMAARAIDILAALAMTAAISRYLGLEMFGDYGFVISLVTFVICCTYFGIERTLTSSLARNSDEREENLSAALYARLILSLVAIFVVVAMLAVMHLPRHVEIAIIVTTVSQLAFSSAQLYGAVFNAFERMEYDTALTLGSQLLALALVLTVILLKLGFVAVFAALALANVGKAFFAIVLVHRRYLKPRFTFNRQRVLGFLSDAFALGLSFMLVQALLRVNVFLLTALDDRAAVALYFAPHSLLVRMQLLPFAVATALLPVFARSADKNPEAFSWGFHKAFAAIMAIGIASLTGGMVLASPIISIIYGREFLGAVVPFRILLLSLVFFFPHPLLSFVLIAKKRQSLLIPGAAAALVLNSLLAVLLIPPYGASGAAIASVAGYTIMGALTLYLLSTRVMPVSIKDIIKKRPRPTAAP